MRRALVLLMLVIACSAPLSTQIDVERVIDGDTFVTRTGERIRLAGINAPERGEPHYLDATIALRSKLIGSQVTIDRLKRDKYDRVVACVYADGKSVDNWMIDFGYARKWIGVTC